MVHIASVWVPFTSESKEAVASYPEIQKELRLGLQAVGRKLGMYLRRRNRVRQEGERRNIFLRYLGEVASAVSEIKGVDREGLYRPIGGRGTTTYRRSRCQVRRAWTACRRRRGRIRRQRLDRSQRRSARRDQSSEPKPSPCSGCRRSGRRRPGQLNPREISSARKEKTSSWRRNARPRKRRLLPVNRHRPSS